MEIQEKNYEYLVTFFGPKIILKKVLISLQASLLSGSIPIAS